MSISLRITVLDPDFTPAPSFDNGLTYKAYTADEMARIREDIAMLVRAASYERGVTERSCPYVGTTLDRLERGRVSPMDMSYVDVVVEEYAPCSDVVVSRTNLLFHCSYGRHEGGMRKWFLTGV